MLPDQETTTCAVRETLLSGTWALRGGKYVYSDTVKITSAPVGQKSSEEQDMSLSREVLWLTESGYIFGRERLGVTDVSEVPSEQELRGKVLHRPNAINEFRRASFSRETPLQTIRRLVQIGEQADQSGAGAKWDRQVRPDAHEWSFLMQEKGLQRRLLAVLVDGKGRAIEYKEFKPLRGQPVNADWPCVFSKKIQYGHGEAGDHPTEVVNTHYETNSQTGQWEAETVVTVSVVGMTKTGLDSLTTPTLFVLNSAAVEKKDKIEDGPR
ncbi:MAG: hypothetical protein N2111_08175 [Candidatus Sumerlaeaceae bacterium]|nr:hypothetical protein [Candidatus Sumerlaeaceae bacterium]